MVNALLGKEGINVNVEDRNGRTLLHWAAWCGHNDVVKTLIEKGADIDAADIYGKTPLHLAAYNGHEEVVEALIQGGADLLLKQKDEKTPINLTKSKEIRQLLKLPEEKQLESATIKGLIAGCSTAALVTAIALALFATGTVAVGLVSVIGAIAIDIATVPAVGSITYSILKPSTKVDETKEEKVDEEKVPGCSVGFYVILLLDNRIYWIPASRAGMTPIIDIFY